MEFVSIKEDIPCNRPGYSRVSVDVDVLLKDGTILRECFCNTETEKFYRPNGKVIPEKKIVGWRS